MVVTNTSASTTAHASFDDPVPAQIVADGGWTTTTTVTGTTATPASATGFPGGVTLTIAPLGAVTFTISAHVPATYDGTEVTNTAAATPGTNTACADGQTPCEANVSFANPAQLEVAKTLDPDDPAPVPGQEFTYTVTVTTWVPAPPLRARSPILFRIRRWTRRARPGRAPPAPGRRAGRRRPTL